MQSTLEEEEEEEKEVLITTINYQAIAVNNEWTNLSEIKFRSVCVHIYRLCFLAKALRTNKKSYHTYLYICSNCV